MILAKPLSCLALALASAGLVPSVAAQQGTASTAPFRVYAVGEITLDRYSVVKRLPVETLASAFWIPGHADQNAAFQALINEAVALGADGLVNVQCLNGGTVAEGGASHYCYGNAIKIR